MSFLKKIYFLTAMLCGTSVFCPDVDVELEAIYKEVFEGVVFAINFYGKEDDNFQVGAFESVCARETSLSVQMKYALSFLSDLFKDKENTINRVREQLAFLGSKCEEEVSVCKEAEIGMHNKSFKYMQTYDWDGRCYIDMYSWLFETLRIAHRLLYFHMHATRILKDLSLVSSLPPSEGKMEVAHFQIVFDTAQDLAALLTEFNNRPSLREGLLNESFSTGVLAFFERAYRWSASDDEEYEDTFWGPVSEETLPKAFCYDECDCDMSDSEWPAGGGASGGCEGPDDE